MDFQCIIIRHVPREVLKTAASGLGFQHLPRDLANVNAWKTMFDPYIVCLWPHKKNTKQFLLHCPIAITDDLLRSSAQLCQPSLSILFYGDLNLTSNENKQIFLLSKTLCWKLKFSKSKPIVNLFSVVHSILYCKIVLLFGSFLMKQMWITIFDSHIKIWKNFMLYDPFPVEPSFWNPFHSIYFFKTFWTVFIYCCID